MCLSIRAFIHDPELSTETFRHELDVVDKYLQLLMNQGKPFVSLS